MPLISIVTVVKDDRDGLGATLASVARQGAGDFEVVVADGGSKDGSLDVARQASGFVMRILEGPDSGIYDGMNKGWRAATGTYVWFVNAGDTLASDSTINELVAFLRAHTARWVYGAVRPVDGEGRPAGPVLLPRYSRHDLEWKGVYLNHQGMLMERSLLEDLGGFRTKFRLAAEYDLFLRAAAVTVPRRYEGVIVDFAVGGMSFENRQQHFREMGQARHEALHLGRLGSARNVALTEYRIMRTKSPLARLPFVRSARDAYLARRHGQAGIN